MNSLSKVLFGDAEPFGEPGKQPASRGPGERPSLVRLSRAGRLPYQHYAGIGNRTRDGAAGHERAGAAGEQRLEVGCKLGTHTLRSRTMRRLGFVLLLLVTLPATAWTPVADERIAKKAATLAPPDLRMLIEKFEGDYRRGLELARADEGSDSHHYFARSRQGRLRDRIERETRGTIAMIRKGDPMSHVVERLGGLAHFVGDANNPFHAANDDPRLSVLRSDYAAFFEQRLAKFPTVFYGLDPKFSLTPYLDRTFARSASFYPLLREEYFRGGERRSAASFDDRSTGFGIASVSYSRAVSDLVNLYYFIWKEAGGDVRSAVVMRDGNLLLNAN
jgi:hypothetical protein